MRKQQRKHEAVPYPEIQRRIIEARPMKDQAFMALMYATGCRVGELCRDYRHSYSIYKIRRIGPGTMKKEFIREQQETTQGIKARDITHDQRVIYIRLPNFKYRKMRYKRAFISKKAEPWLCKIILEYVLDVQENVYLFEWKELTARRHLAKIWPYTTHSLRVSRATNLYYDMRVGLREIADQLGHRDVSHLMTYLKSRPEMYINQMEKADLPQWVD